MRLKSAGLSTIQMSYGGYDLESFDRDLARFCVEPGISVTLSVVNIEKSGHNDNLSLLGNKEEPFNVFERTPLMDTAVEGSTGAKPMHEARKAAVAPPQQPPAARSATAPAAGHPHPANGPGRSPPCGALVILPAGDGDAPGQGPAGEGTSMTDETPRDASDDGGAGRAGDPAPSPPTLACGKSLAARLRERFGPDVDPGVSLEPQGTPAAPSDFSSQVLARLASRPDASGRYRLQGEVAQGGMGVIVRVWDEDLHRHLAMKLMLGRVSPPAGVESDPAAATPALPARSVGRFLEEAQVTGQLDHPGIVPVHELGLDQDGRVFFTMKLVKGEDLKAVFARVHAGEEGWSVTHVLGLLQRSCEALAYAHAKRVIHRDLKPANLMIGKFGEVYVMDWGLARLLDRPDDKDLRLRPEHVAATTELNSPRHEAVAAQSDSPLVTMDGDIVGTPAYMSPEQARGELARLGPPTDVYALGAMLYHLLAGRMPYVVPGAYANQHMILGRVQEGPPRPLHELAPDVPAELVAICERAMEREPQDRYPHMTALSDDLRAYLEHRVVSAYETGALAEARKWVVRNKPLAAALAAGVLLLVGGLTSSLMLKGRSDRNAAVASANATLADANAMQARQAAELAEQRLLEADEQRGRAEGSAQLAEEQRQVAQTQERLATQRADDVLSLSAIQELKELAEQADALWPAEPDRLPDYARWLRQAQVLIEGSPADPAQGIAAHPSLKDHEAKLAELRLRAKPLTPEQTEQGRRASPSWPEWEQARAKLTWMRRMLGELSWPGEADVEAALAQETLPADADGLNSLAWSLVDTDPTMVVYGSEVKALILARRAVAAAADAERAGIRVTLAMALYCCGRAEEALAEVSRAVEEAPAEQKQILEFRLEQLHELVAGWTQDEPRSQQAEEARELSARVAELERDVNARRTYEFEDAQNRWWHSQLSGLVADLKAFTDEQTGLFSAGISELYGWGIGKRAAFARTIEEQSVTGAEAQARWSAAIGAIRVSPEYAGLVLTPQLGLLPIGQDPDSGLWEFWHIQSGDEPLRGADGRLALTEKLGVVLVLIPGGSFWMGAQKDDPQGRNYDPLAEDEEGPVHEVTLSPYLLSKYELTQGQWQRFTARHPSNYAPGTIIGGHPTTLMHPVEQVSWNDATEVLPRIGLELPSEAQWERGARAGTDTPWWTGRARETLVGAVNLADQAAARAGATWSDIKDWPELDDGWVVHAAVGSFRPNAFGLHDVHGNVWEWCLDGYDSGFYGSSREADPVRDPAGARGRVLRGGSYSLAASYARSAIRSLLTPEYRDYYLGLRPAMGITPE